MLHLTSVCRSGLLAALVLACSGCATLQRGRNEDVRIDVEPAFAAVTTSLGRTCKGTCALSVPRSEGFVVNAAAPGYFPQSVRVEPSLSWEGTRSVASNAAGPLFVGVGVDVYTGAGFDHAPNPVVIRLRRRPDAGPATAAPGHP